MCWINSVHGSSHQLDDKHMHSADQGNGSSLKTKPVFLFQGRSVGYHSWLIWQGHAGQAVTLINNCWLSRHCFKQPEELWQWNYCNKISYDTLKDKRGTEVKKETIIQNCGGSVHSALSALPNLSRWKKKSSHFEGSSTAF